MSLYQDNLRKRSVEDMVSADALLENKAVYAKNAAIQTANLVPGVNKPLLPLVVTKEMEENRVTVLKKMGFTNGEQVAYFSAAVDANLGLKKVFADFEKDFATNKYNDVLGRIGAQVLADGKKVNFDEDAAKKSGTGIIDKLAKDLKGENGPKIITQLRTHPEIISAKIDGYAAGTVPIADLLAQPRGLVGGTAPPKPTPEIVDPAPVKVAVAQRTSPPLTQTPSPAPKAAVPPAQAANAPPSARQSPPVDLEAEYLTELAGLSNQEMKTKLDKKDVKLILKGMADQAETKFGVSAATGFKNRIGAGDPKLADDRLLTQITANFQGNPEFVRQLARMAKDKTPLTGTEKQMAQSEMNKLMANPELLASSRYVQEMQQKIQMAEKFKNEGIGGMFKSMFAQFGAGFGNFGSIFAGFSGPNTVFTMAKGGGFFPSLMINLGAKAANEAIAYARSTVGANDLKTFPEPYKTVMVKGADGKQVAQEVPNAFKMQINGKETDVILARGLMANEVKGHIDPTTNQFVPSNKVAFWGTRSVGGQPELLYTSKADFLKYKEAVDAASAKYGDGKQLAFTDYTEQDARASLRNQPQIRVASVDPQTGAVTQKQMVAGMAVTQGQIRPKNTTASGQDMDYELQG